MAQIKSSTAAASKWKRRSETAQGEYEEGVRSPRTGWAQATAASEKAYEAGVQAAIGRKAFGAGVKNAGDTKWQQNALAKGPARYTQGVGLAENAYEAGFAPYRQVISNLNLPARGPKGDPTNIQRVAAVAKALHDAKLKTTGGK